MLKELFRIPGFDFPIYSYGVMLVIGTMAAIWLAQVLAKRRGFDPEIFVNAGLLALLAGVAGARLSHVLENADQYFGHGMSVWETVKSVFNIREGGLTYYGGFLLAFPVLVIYAIRKKVSVRKGMDIIAPCIMVGLAFGRIGCLLNGCCYGQEYNGMFAATFPYCSDVYLEQVQKGEIHPPASLYWMTPDGRSVLIRPEMAKNDPDLLSLMKQQRSRPVHPTQIYSSVTAFGLAALLIAFFAFNKVPGHVFALMLLTEPVTRFVLEMLRVEPAVIGRLSLSMALAIPQYALGVVLWVAFWWYHRRRETGDAAGQSHLAASGSR